MENVQDFWIGLAVVLKEIYGMADEPAAETLIDYLERYREGWTAIAASMHASPGRRALVAPGRLRRTGIFHSADQAVLVDRSAGEVVATKGGVADACSAVLS